MRSPPPIAHGEVFGQVIDVVANAGEQRLPAHIPQSEKLHIHAEPPVPVGRDHD